MAKTQDYRLGEFTFPRGWFMVAESAQARVKAAQILERVTGVHGAKGCPSVAEFADRR